MVGWFLQAHSRLSKARTVGFGANPIALSEIVIYWEKVSRIGSLVEFIRIIQAMDGVYLKEQKERSKSSQT